MTVPLKSAGSLGRLTTMRVAYGAVLDGVTTPATVGGQRTLRRVGAHGSGEEELRLFVAHGPRSNDVEIKVGLPGTGPVTPGAAAGLLICAPLGVATNAVAPARRIAMRVATSECKTLLGSGRIVLPESPNIAYRRPSIRPRSRP